MEPAGNAQDYSSTSRTAASNGAISDRPGYGLSVDGFETSADKDKSKKSYKGKFKVSHNFDGEVSNDLL